MTHLAVEMDDIGRGYGKIHRARCGDLRDPLDLGEHATCESVSEALTSLVGSDWYYTADEVREHLLAPCAANV